MNKTIPIFLLLLSLFLVFSCSTPIEEYQAKNNDEKDIIDLLKRYTKIINTGNTEQILTLFHENGVYVTGRGNVSPFQGRKCQKGNRRIGCLMVLEVYTIQR